MTSFPSYSENDVSYTVASLLTQLATLVEKGQIQIRLQAEIDAVIDSDVSQIHYVTINNIQTTLDFVRSFSLLAESREFVKQFMPIIILCDSSEREELKMLINQ